MSSSLRLKDQPVSERPRERLAALAFDPVGGSQESAARYVKAEIAKWATIVKATGARAE